MKPLKFIDAAFLQLETEQTPMHVGALFVLQPSSDRQRARFTAQLKATVQSHLGHSEVFTRRLARLPFDIANPFWVMERDIDLDFHIRRTRLPGPGTQAQLERCVALLHEPLMDRTRPLWELHVIDGLEGDRIALYVKTHHAGVDGASAQVFLQSFVDASPDAKGPRRKEPRPRPDDVSLASTLLAGVGHQARQIALLPARVTEIGGTAIDVLRNFRPSLPSGDSLRGCPRTPFNVRVTSERGFAWREFPLEAAKAIAKRHDATVNDVILAAVAGAVRLWLRQVGELPDQSLAAAVPVSTREAGNTEHSIQVSFMQVELHTNVDDPHARLEAIHASAAQSKQKASQLKAMLPEDIASIGLPWILGGLARLIGREGVVERVPLPMNVLVSNVAGPPFPLYIAGARALTYAPVSIPYHGCGLNITVYSYDGKLFFGLTSATNALPEIDEVANGVASELKLLAKPRAKGGRKTRRKGAK
jgi:WS/DGAT/MGAT family acyltransferase